MSPGAPRAPGILDDGGPPGDPRSDPRAFLDACARRYGPVFTLTADQTHVRSPDLVRHVLRREVEFELAPELVTTKRDAIQIDSPERWKLARRLIWDGVDADSCAAAAPHLVRRWRDQFADGVRFSGVDPVVLATAAVQWPLILRDSARPDLGPLLLATSRRRQRTINGLTPWGRFRLRRQFDQAIDGLLAAIARRRAGYAEAASPDLLDALLADDTGTLSDIDIAQSLAICLDSAMMTTGAAVCWTLVALADRSPETLAELREPDQAEAFVCEVLRHTPVIEMLNRTATTNTQLGDHQVAARSTVLLDVAALHHEPELWNDDPEQFCPARWNGDRPHTPGAYLSFGAGPRFCLGSRIATATLTTLVQTLTDGYTIECATSPQCRRDNLNWPDPFEGAVTPPPG